MCLRRISFLLLLMISSAVALLADDVCRGRADPLAQAIIFMQGLHRDLMIDSPTLRIVGEQDFRRRTPPFFGDFVLEVLHYTLEPPNPKHPGMFGRVPRAIVGGRFMFYADCTPSHYGKTVLPGDPPSQVERTRNLVNSHPEWDDARILKELKEAGARYTPDQKDAFMKSLPLGPLQTLLGRIQITRVEFKTAEADHEGNFADLSWTVNIRATANGQKTEEYAVNCDPFDGTLDSFSIGTRTWRLHGRH